MEDWSPSARKLLLALFVVAAIVVSFAGGYVISQATRETPAEALTVIDDFGRIVSVPVPVERIVSLAASNTEIIFALGLEDKLVAVDHTSDHPAALDDLNLTRINTFPAVDQEAILALNPDLILAADIIAITDIEALSTQGLPVLVLGPNTLDGILEDILLVGLVTDALAEAEQLVDDLQARIDAVMAATAAVAERPLVYLEFFPFWTFGPGSFGHDLIVMAGGRNVGASLTSPFGEVSSEFVVAANPDVIVYTLGPFTATTPEDIEGRVGWDTIAAVMEGEIHDVDDNEVARAGPRMVNALEDLARILHPDLFP